MKSLVELPASDVLSPRQIDEWLKNATNPKAGDAEMGLPLEEGEGDSRHRWKTSRISIRCMRPESQATDARVRIRGPPSDAEDSPRKPRIP
jgi:hypothetical protein